MQLIVRIALFIIFVAIAFYLYLFYSEEVEADHLTLYGNVDVRQADLGFRVAGRVDKLYFEEGDVVPPGTLMATLDKQPYADEVVKAEAAMESAKISLDNAIRNLNRRQEIVSGGAVSKEDFDNAQTQKNVADANLKEAIASLGVATTNYNDTELYSPSDGVILTRIREPGTVVKASDPVFTLSLTSPVWIRAFVSEPDLGKIYPGMKAEVYTDTKNGKVYEGHIGFISPVAEFTPKTVETTHLRTDLVYRIRVITNNPDRGLRQGMPVTVILKLTPQETTEKK